MARRPWRTVWRLVVSAALAGGVGGCEPAPPTLTATPAAPAPGRFEKDKDSSSERNAPEATIDPPGAQPAELRLLVHIVPIGNVPPETISLTAQALARAGAVDTVVEPAHAVPHAARSPRPGALRADALLAWLDTMGLDRGKILGVTEADIVTRKGQVPIWGILGMGSMGGRSAAISTYRMRRRWERGGAPEHLVRDRLWKVAVHELGHTLALDHCPTVGCIMEDGQGTVKTVDRDTDLCASCAGRFAAAIAEHATR